MVNKVFKALVIILVLVSFYFYFNKDLNYQPLHEDEQNFVSRSRYFDLFFLKKNLFSKEWLEMPAYDQPPVSYYVYGLALHLSGYNNLATEQGKIGFNDPYIDNPALSEPSKPWWVRLQNNERIDNLPSVLKPSFEMIWEARKAAVIFSLGSLFLIFLIGQEVGGFVTGILSVVILGLNELFFVTARRAMADPILLFFLLLGFILSLKAIRAFNKKNWFKFLSISSFIGISAALAAGTKLNGGMSLIVWIIMIFILLFMSLIKGDLKKKKLVSLINSLSISVTVFSYFFILFNPFLYINPLNGLNIMMDHRVNTAIIQQSEFPNDALITLQERFLSVFDKTLLTEWRNFKLPVLDLLFFIGGLVLLFIFSLSNIKKSKFISLELITLGWILIYFGLVAIYLPLEWPRYYLPIIPCIVVGQAYFLNRTIKYMRTKLIEKKSKLWDNCSVK